MHMCTNILKMTTTDFVTFKMLNCYTIKITKGKFKLFCVEAEQKCLN